MISILIADDHHLVRQGIRALLDGAPNIEVIGEADDGRQAVQMTEEKRPDVVVMDVSMPEMDGIAATREICTLNFAARVVLLSMYASVELVEQAIRNGARGYLLKRSTATELVRAVNKIVNGEIFLDARLSLDNENEIRQQASGCPE